MKGSATFPSYAPAGAVSALLLLSLLGSLGCRSERDGLEPQATGPGACAGTCHGEGDNPAPPNDLDGNSTTSSPGVGAHAMHLASNGAHVAVTCEQCHVVPKSTDAPGHADNARPAELVFTGIALTGGRAPNYDPATHTCSDSYCHSGPGTAGIPWPNTAVWTAPRDWTSACGTSCHGTPPGGSHPASTQCELCHTDTAGPGLTIINPAKHMNGVVDVAGGACSACHGSEDNPAPPRDLAGGSDTASVTVGAHQSHLKGGAFSRAVECAACHLVPADVSAPGHTDTDSPAEVTFGELATTGGAQPLWDRSTATCSASYCHGSEAKGGARVTPTWTRVDGSQATCGSCHALPPPPPHVANPDCEKCHTQTAGPNHTIANRDNHINGTVDIPGGPCNKCHGDDTGYAPPRDTDGNTDTASPGVGAHRSHLDAAKMSFAAPFSCDVCHVLPPLSTTHLNGNVDLAFSGAATGTVDDAPVSHTSAPSYDSASRACSNVYCHGGWTESANPSGGSVAAPIWNQVDGSQVACGTCHSLPPPPPHPASGTCQNCHPAVVDDQLQFVDITKHINGRVDFQ